MKNKIGGLKRTNRISSNAVGDLHMKDNTGKKSNVTLLSHSDVK